MIKLTRGIVQIHINIRSRRNAPVAHKNHARTELNNICTNTYILQVQNLKLHKFSDYPKRAKDTTKRIILFSLVTSVNLTNIEINLYLFFYCTVTFVVKFTLVNDRRQHAVSNRNEFTSVQHVNKYRIEKKFRIGAVQQRGL